MTDFSFSNTLKWSWSVCNPWRLLDSREDKFKSSCNSICHVITSTRPATKPKPPEQILGQTGYDICINHAVNCRGYKCRLRQRDSIQSWKHKSAMKVSMLIKKLFHQHDVNFYYLQHLFLANLGKEFRLAECRVTLPSAQWWCQIFVASCESCTNFALALWLD